MGDLRWEKKMGTIQNITGAPVAAEIKRPAPADSGAPAIAAASAARSQQKSRVREPVAPKVDFDPKKMQQELEEAVERLNKMMESGKRGLGFSVDNQINVTVVTVKDTNTGEVVRQIPSEAVLRVAHRIEDLKGILYSKDV
jgi:flagellar protein FlaG